MVKDGKNKTILRKTLICHHYTILYRQVNKKKPANLLRPDSIIHQYPDIMNPWSKVKTGGNRPRKSSLQIRWYCAYNPIWSGSWERLLVVWSVDRDSHPVRSVYYPNV